MSVGRNQREFIDAIICKIVNGLPFEPLEADFVIAILRSAGKSIPDEPANGSIGRPREMEPTEICMLHAINLNKGMRKDESYKSIGVLYDKSKQTIGRIIRENDEILKNQSQLIENSIVVRRSGNRN